MNRKDSILDQLSTLKHLPTLPHILLKLIKSCNQDSGNLKDISGIVEKDPSLAGRILKLVNSTYYGLPRKIGTIEQAVTYLGTNAVKNTAICASVMGVFSRPQTGSIPSLKSFWRHSLKCALLSRSLAKKTGQGDPEEAFLAGLLHDIGRLILWTNYREEYGNLWEMYRDRPDLLIAGEIRLGATHSEIGAFLLRRWKLPSFMADSVLYHHEPLSRIKGALPLVQIVYAANALGSDSIQNADPDFHIAQDLLRLTRPDLDRISSQAEEELAEAAEYLDLEIGKAGERIQPFSEKDMKKQEDLADEVRDASLLLGTLQNLLGAEDETAVLREVYRGLEILFDLKAVLFFLYDPERNGLLGRSLAQPKEPNLLDDLLIPLQVEDSLLVRCIRLGVPMNSFGATAPGSGPAIVDEQILRFLRAGGMFCLPLTAYGDMVGVILIGLEETEFASLSRGTKILEMLAREAAVALHVHALRRARLKNVQEERLLASSAMARKIVHEVNNPLSIIKNYLKILGMKLAQKDMAQDEIRIINEEIDRVTSMIGELTSFSNDPGHRAEEVDLNALLSDLVKISREALLENAGVEIQTDLEASLPPVSGDRNSLKQVFVNLVKNASEALTGGGDIRIKTRHISSRIKGGAAPPQKGAGEFVEITFSDNGPGIPEEIRSRVFDPYVGTKGGGHAGLGLSIVHTIIKGLNGNISCESEKDGGTTFRIDLPVVRK